MTEKIVYWYPFGEHKLAGSDYKGFTKELLRSYRIPHNRADDLNLELEELHLAIWSWDPDTDTNPSVEVIARGADDSYAASIDLATWIDSSISWSDEDIKSLIKLRDRLTVMIADREERNKQIDGG